MSRNRCIAGRVSLVLALIAAMPAKAAAPAITTEPAGTSVVTYDAGFARWLDAPKTVELSRGVTFNQDDAYLKMDAAVVQLDAEQHALNAHSLGSVHLYNPQDDLTGYHGAIDFTRHVATITDNVVLLVKPGPEERAAPPGSVRSKFTEPATLTCETILYDYRHRTGHVPGPLTVKQGDRVLTADSGDYDAHTHIVTLTGHVHGHDADDAIDAPKVSMNIEAGAESITIPVPVHGVFKVRDNTSTDDTATPANTKPASSQ